MQISNSKIFIISSPRVGSTALLAYLKRILHVTYPDIVDFSEPYYLRNTNPEYLINMKDAVELNKKFIIKIHHWNFHCYDQTIINYLSSSSEVFRIQLLRKDVIAQISSFYIATMRNKKYHFYKGQDNFTDTIPLDNEIMRTCVERILLYNRNLLEEKINYNLKLYYEDLPKMNNIPNIVVPKPVNYNIITNEIENLILNQQLTNSSP